MPTQQHHSSIHRKTHTPEKRLSYHQPTPNLHSTPTHTDFPPTPQALVIHSRQDSEAKNTVPASFSLTKKRKEGKNIKTMYGRVV